MRPWCRPKRAGQPGRPRPGAPSPTDPDAAWTGRGAKAHFGYKVHLGVDAGSGLIRAACLTPAQIAESTVAETLILGDETAVYADRAYESQQRRARLKAQGIKDRIMHRSHKYQARLPYWQRRRNALIARVRAPVEQVFGTLKRLYRYRRVRYLGLARNATELWCKCLAYNLRRAERLLRPSGGGLGSGVGSGAGAPGRPPARSRQRPEAPPASGALVMQRSHMVERGSLFSLPSFPHQRESRAPTPTDLTGESSVPHT